ncbi:hypothetical protein ANRL4_05459 [Anaerolineae bacterium]|nr:hypothetical protein ANRL4_05459 [Anaerolineae bacterium]
MAKNPVRRAQLIAPFGVGAMTVVQGGIGLITAGLDHWFKREDNARQVDVDEYLVEEWRLERLLHVDHFRLPPDYREVKVAGQAVPNTGLTVPFLRFPRWHFCPRCHRLEEHPLTERGRPKCQECPKTSYLFQVPFVAMCEAGHLQDFPWREWVHRNGHPSCTGILRLSSTGSASLSSQRVKCECGASRDLGSIMEATPDGRTFLSRNLLENGIEFFCRGMKPWLGDDQGEECKCHLKGSLRSASNIYFAQVRSAIYLPREDSVVSQELVAMFEQPPLSTLTRTLYDVTEAIDPDTRWQTICIGLRRQYPLLLGRYNDEQVRRVTEITMGTTNDSHNQEPQFRDEDTEAHFRREEFQVLRQPREGSILSIREVPIDSYKFAIPSHFEKIMLVDRLRETRAMAGFTRMFADNAQTLEERVSLLRRDGARDNWLPAYVVFGEGIFLELNERRLQAWENQPQVVQRIKLLENRFVAVQQSRRLRQQSITPRFVLLHTLAHLIMNRLTFECGYSSAALRERIYVSTSPDAPMAGILIYTADGDVEGTMGGLVRMGKPGNIEPIIQRALQNALWCSADPVCMEIGGKSGQGPDSCNLAACHNCALVPETACEHFNRFLDRAVVINDFEGADLGFFDLGEM